MSGQIHTARNNWEEGEVTFTAAEIQKHLESRLDLARMRYFRGVMRLKKGETGQAVTYLHIALDLFEAWQGIGWTKSGKPFQEIKSRAFILVYSSDQSVA